MHDIPLTFLLYHVFAHEKLRLNDLVELNQKPVMVVCIC
jgi:hypothetical protein